MGTSHCQASCTHADEDYIDMEVSSSPSFLCYSISSPPESREFEFQMCSTSSTSPADELFYKGKLLPLHLPRRLQMVQKLLQSSTITTYEAPFEEDSLVPFITGSAIASTNASAPLESCRVSGELNPEPDDYFFEQNGFIGKNSKNCWSRKLKQIKQSSIGQKLKASRAYLKTLFTKSACLDESCRKAPCNADADAEIVSEGKGCVNKYMKMAKKNPFGKIDNDRYKISSSNMKSIDGELVEDAANSHRRSFSGVIQRHSAAKSSSTSTSSSSSGSSSSSSSFSFSSSGLICDLQSLKRSNSANSEIENSIEGAIAHCKQSQQLSTSTKTASELGVCSLSATKISP